MGLINKVYVPTLLKDLQPYRKKPSKDQLKWCAVGELHANKQLPEDHNVREHSYWTVYPSKKAVKDAKYFLLGQIVYTPGGKDNLLNV